MPTLTLTDRAVAALRPPKTGQLDYFDEKSPGLGVRVSHGGTKTWFMKYLFNGRQKRLSLGRYPDLSLRKARRKALAIRNDIADGTDPAISRATTQPLPTFKDLTEAYINRHAKPKKRSWKEDERILNRYCHTFQNKRLKDISRSAIVDLIHQISQSGSPIMANRVLACVRKAFNFGIRAGICETNPAHFVEAPAPERVRDRVYSEDELRRLWKVFEARGMAGRVFQVCLATGQRLREVSGMRWDEIEGDVWTIQGARTKNKRTHVVPLNEMAKSVIERQRGIDETFVFPSTRRSRSRIGDQSENEAPKERSDGENIVGEGNSSSSARRVPTIHALANFGKAVVFIRENSSVRDFRAHDLRRTVATELARLGTAESLIGRILNHAPEGVTARHYDRYEYLEEKRVFLHRWAKRLSEIVSRLIGG